MKALPIRKYKPYYRESLLLAIPVVFSQVGHVLVQFADSVIVGHFAGTISLAAVSLVNSIFVIGMVIGLGVSYGITPLIAQHNGRKNYKECGKLLSNALVINTITGIALFIFISVGMMLIIGHLGPNASEVVRQSQAILICSRWVYHLCHLSLFNTFKTIC